MQWWKHALNVILCVTTIWTLVQMVRFFFSKETLVTLAGLEFDDEALFQLYGWIAILLGGALVLVNWYWMSRTFRPKSYRFGDLASELRQLHGQVSAMKAMQFGGGGSLSGYVELRTACSLVQEKLEKLRITCPSDSASLQTWDNFLAIMKVLAEQRQYRRAVRTMDWDWLEE